MASLLPVAGVVRVRRAVAAVRSGFSASLVSLLPLVPTLSVACAGGCFLGVPLVAVLWLVDGSDQPEVLALLGLLAFGMAFCVPALFCLGLEPPAAPLPVAPQPVEPPVPVAPQPLWRCLEPLPDDGSPLPGQVARRLAEAVDAGRLLPRSVVPTDQHIARHFKVSVGTARRAKSLARSWGHLTVEYGGRLIVAVRPDASAVEVKR